LSAQQNGFGNFPKPFYFNVQLGSVFLDRRAFGVGKLIYITKAGISLSFFF
jgi:hypothetical protein